MQETFLETFLLYTEHREMIDKLSNEDAGSLIKGVLEYAATGKIPKLKPIVEIVFILMRQAIDRNRAKYEQIVEKQKQNGLKGGRPKKPRVNLETQNNPKNPPLFLETQKSYNDNDSDNDNVNDNVFFNSEEKTKISDPTVNPVTEKFIEEYKKNFNSTPFLNYAQRMKLVEIANDNPNFIENIPLLLEKFSSIEFEFKDGKKKPGLSWLIDKENWSAVLNGDFDKHTEGECQNEYNPCL